MPFNALVWSSLVWCVQFICHSVDTESSIEWLEVGLYRIADFTIWPNKNNSFYYLAEYK